MTPIQTGPAEHLDRVASRIGEVIVAFWRERVKSEEPQFHARELLERVVEEAGISCSPDSPSRILRLLKRAGRVNYELVSRADSLYRAVPVRAQLEMGL